MGLLPVAAAIREQNLLSRIESWLVKDTTYDERAGL
jgi:hypothetical protein